MGVPGLMRTLTQSHRTYAKTVVVIGCPSDFVDFIAIMDLYLAPGSEIHVLTEKDVSWRKENRNKMHKLDNLDKDHGIQDYRGLPTSKRDLATLPLNRAHTVIILAEGTDASFKEESSIAIDTQNLTTAVMLLTMLPDTCPILCELVHPRSEKVIKSNKALTSENITYFHSNMLETAMFALAAENKQVYNIIMHLLQPQNPEGDIIAVPIRNFVDGTEELSFLDLHGRVSKKWNRVLLGWSRSGSRPEINPEEKIDKLSWTDQSDDQLLLLERRPSESQGKESQLAQADTMKILPSEISTPNTPNAIPACLPGATNACSE